VKFEYRVFRCQVGWDGGDYYLEAKVQKEEEWTNANELGAEGWELVGFWPDEKPYIKDSFPEGYQSLVKMCVFKRIVENVSEPGEFKVTTFRR